MSNANSKIERGELKKVITIWDYFTMGFGAMVGIGWVVTIGTWITKAGGPLGAIIAFILGGLLMIPIGFVFAELCSAMPVSGGEMAFTYRGFGTKVSFFTGWFLLLAYIGLCPWESVAIGNLVAAIFPALSFGVIYSVGGYDIQWPLLLIGLAVSFVIFYINTIGIDKTAKFQTWMTNLLIACSVVMIVAGIALGKVSNLHPLWTDPNVYGTGSLTKIGGMLAIFAITPFFLSGFDVIPQSAEESSAGTDHKTLGRTIVMVIAFGATFYSLCIFSISMITPWKELNTLSFPAADALKCVSPMLGDIVLVGALAGLVTTFNGFFCSAARMLFAMGRCRMLPIWFAVLHPVYKTPVNAIKFIAFITVLGTFVGKIIVLPIINVGTFGFMIAWLIICLASIKLRKTEPTLVRPYTMPGGVLCGYIACFSCIVIIGILLFPNSPGALDFPIEYIATLAWVCLGAILYTLASKNRNDITENEREYLIFGSVAEKSSSRGQPTKRIE